MTGPLPKRTDISLFLRWTLGREQKSKDHLDTTFIIRDGYESNWHDTNLIDMQNTGPAGMTGQRSDKRSSMEANQMGDS